MFVNMLSSTFTQALSSMQSLVASILPSLLSSGPPPGPKPSGFLTITDSRTSRQYDIPIHRNAVEAIRFKEIRAPKDYHHPADKSEGGLRLFDQGFQNTAVMASEVTYVDGIEGSIRYRDISIIDLVGKKRFEDVTFLLIWGHLPSQNQREKYKKELAAAMAPPQMVSDVIRSFPYVKAPVQQPTRPVMRELI